MSTKNSNKTENVLVNEVENVAGVFEIGNFENDFFSIKAFKNVTFNEKTKHYDVEKTLEIKTNEKTRAAVYNAYMTKDDDGNFKRGSFADVAAAVGACLVASGKDGNDRNTPRVKFECAGAVCWYDLHDFLKLCNVQRVDKDGNKPDGKKGTHSTKGKTKDEKLRILYENFKNSIIELTSDEKLLNAIEALNEHIERVAEALIDSDKLNTETKSTFAQAAGLLSFEQQKQLKGMSAEEISAKIAAVLAAESKIN